MHGFRCESDRNEQGSIVCYKPFLRTCYLLYPRIKRTFNDWLGEIEQEVLEFLENRNEVDPNEVAEHFRLERESVIFILGKLAREGKINMQASRTGKWQVD